MARGAIGQSVEKEVAVTALPQAAVEQYDDAAIGCRSNQAPKALAQPEDRLRHCVFVEGVLVEAAASSVERVGWNGEGEACDEEADELLAGEIDPFPVAAGAEEKRARVGTKVAQVAAPAALALLENGKTGCSEGRADCFRGRTQVAVACEEDESPAFGGQSSLLDGLLKRALVAVMIGRRHVAGCVEQGVLPVVEGAADHGAAGVPAAQAIAQEVESIAGLKGSAGQHDRAPGAEQVGGQFLADLNGSASQRYRRGAAAKAGGGGGN